MKAAFKKSKKQIEIREVDIPRINDEECLVKTKASGVCASDRWWLDDNKYSNHVFGHEAAGEIVEVGKNVSFWKKGDRVCLYGPIGCGNCQYCAQGMDTRCLNHRLLDNGFSEYIAAPSRSLIKIPDETDYFQGSMLIDMLGTPMRALRQGGVKKDDTVVIWGLGPLGLLAVQGAKVFGARTVVGVDLLENRLNLATKLGTDYAVNPKEGDAVAQLEKLLGRDKIDVSINTVLDSKVATQSYYCVRLGGTCVLIIGAPILRPEPEERNLTAVWYMVKGEYKENVEFVLSGKVKLKPLITHIVPFEEINEGFILKFDKQHEAIKVILSFD